MTKPIDLTKFRKTITKAIPGISGGFTESSTWISTGSYSLNFLISGDFYKGIPLGKISILAGQSGSGKSFLASGNIVRNAQQQGMFVVLFDTENALDEKWLQDLGVDTSPEKLLRLGVTLVDDVAKTIATFMDEYRSNYSELPREEQPKVLFVIDSLGMLQTPVSVSHFTEGNQKGDMGIKAKQLKSLISNTVNLIAPYEIGMICTNHTYASQNMFDPDDVIAGGSGPIFAASIVVAMQKLKLKEDDEGNKITDVAGIKSVCKVVKTRYSKPFETVKINIPYDTGLNPISGLFDIFEKSGKLKKQGNRYLYVDKKGVEHLYYRKQWNTIENMKIIMDEFTQDDLHVVQEGTTDNDD